MNVHLRNKLDNRHHRAHIREGVECRYLFAHTKGISNWVRLIPLRKCGIRDQNVQCVCNELLKNDHLTVASLVPPLGLSHGEVLHQSLDYKTSKTALTCEKVSDTRQYFELSYRNTLTL